MLGFARRAGAAMVAMWPLTLCPAQSVYQVSDGSTSSNGESQVAVDTIDNNQVVVIWQAQQADVVVLKYAVTLNGFASSATPQTLPPPNTFSTPNCYTMCGIAPGDPVAARSRLDGSMLVGGFFAAGGNSATGVARRAHGATDLERNGSNQVIVRMAMPCNAATDRDSLCIGPRPPVPPFTFNHPESAYFTFSNHGFMGSGRSRDAVVGSDWELCAPAPSTDNTGFPTPITSDAEPGGREGTGNPAAVLPGTAGVGAAGRIVVASCYGSGAQSTEPAEVTWSDTGGGPRPPASGHPDPWSAAQPLDRYGPANLTVRGILDEMTGQVPVPADVRPQFKSAPSISFDPRSGHTNEVWVAWTGRDPQTPNEIDVFLAWTRTAADTGGPVFQSANNPWDPSSPPLRRTYRIPDAMLLQTGEYSAGNRYQQFLVNVVVDDQGGINFGFYQTLCPIDPPVPTKVTFRYARWASWTALDSGASPQILWVGPIHDPWIGNSGNDYTGLTAGSCRVYASWADSHTGTWRVYVLNYNICAADTDNSATVDAHDPIAFASAYAALQPAADVNRDDVINAQDVADFFTAYACGACSLPPP